MSKSKLLKSVVIGAFAGAVISMLDRNTRQHTIECVKKAKETVTYYAKNSQELQQLIEDKIDVVQSLYENTTENVNALVDKIEEVKEIPVTIQEIVNDTKSVFSNDNDEIN